MVHVYFVDGRAPLHLRAPTLKELFAKLTVRGIDTTNYLRHPSTCPSWAKQLYFQHSAAGIKNVLGWSPVRASNSKPAEEAA